MKNIPLPILLLLIFSLIFLPACAAVGNLPNLASRLVGDQAADLRKESPEIIQAVQDQPPSAPLPQSDVIAAFQGTLEQIYQQVSPSVVNIQVVSQQTVPGMPDIPGLPDSHPQIPQGGVGSGFIWDQQGHIVTNNHVVAGASRIDVVFSDGSVASGELVGADPNSDLAVIRVDMPADDLMPVQLADSNAVNVGQLAVAIGNPFGLQGTMTVGVISAIGRSLPIEAGASLQGVYSIPEVIQTDAPINPGNSGGVLLNGQGQVVGVTTAIESPVQANAGVGFAVPSAIVAKVVPALIEDGAYQYPWLGVSGRNLAPALAEAMGLDEDQRGALVITLVEGGPGEAAGLRPSTEQAEIEGVPVEVGGDVITAMDGEPIQSMDDLIAYLALNTEAGQEVTLTVLRDGRETELEVTLGARPASDAQTAPELPEVVSGPWLGVNAVTVTPELAQVIGLREAEGVLIVEIVPDSPADEAGLRGGTRSVEVDGETIRVGGDLLLAVEGEATPDVETLQAVLQEFSPGDEVTLSLMRDGREIEVDVTLSSPFQVNP